MSNDDPTTGQVAASAAEVYDAFFVPALFGGWPGRVFRAVGLAAGDHVLDVGCGTGVGAREAARRLDGSGSVTGIDRSEGMLAVARRAPETVDWHHGVAERLPFPSGSFDRTVSLFALMFFEDRGSAIAEMARVTRPAGTIGLATWASIEQSPGYAAMHTLLDRLFGDEVAAALTAPFVLGEIDDLARVVGDAVADVRVARHDGLARFDSLDAWLHTEIRGWTLADTIDDDQFVELQAAARRELARFVAPDGHVEFAAPALIATGSVISGTRSVDIDSRRAE